MTTTDLLTSMWGVLSVLWLLSALSSFVLVYLSWPTERVPRSLMALGCIAFTAYFFWRWAVGSDVQASSTSFVRNLCNLFFVLAYLIDKIWAVRGVIERRAHRASVAKGVTQRV